MEPKRKSTFGLEARLFLIIFVVATAISTVFAFNMYNQEKRNAEQALADELIRAARMFSAMLDVDDIEQLLLGACLSNHPTPQELG